MAFSYDPKDANNLIPDGEYDAEVSDVEEQTSKAGNAMLKLTVHIWAHGDKRIVWDYIVVPSTLWKLRTLAAAVGLGQKFEAGTLVPADLVGKDVRVAVKTRKDESGNYGDQNVIAKYIAAQMASAPPVGLGANRLDDDMPF